ncbi:MAG: hypothetical protein JRI79_08670 [Deltaproteobacteria bacterium]|nr:hypothetical protein [Deltaproteobacteria bacterium]MBW1919502.1 hypothetical protein [Deltaproteobacteria bacterium]MBW1934861.1 hypothetical protein [Deltaproteobacteria bacterium]MBW1978021.1 hypothetical protein [Deltaproteobacteria bacterium]MBW2045659.1 hypothetical protein [Deltaproteobacteria bacterium]
MDLVQLTDRLWLRIAPLFSTASSLLGAAFSPFMLLGPELGIASIAALTYIVTRILSRLYSPRAIEKLQEEFNKLKEMREEAASHGAKEVCKGLDDEMDKIYFEQMRVSIVRGSAVHSIPMLAMLCWVWSYFSPETLQRMYGKPYVVKLPFTIGIYDHIGAGFWFVICLGLVWALAVAVKRVRRKETQVPAEKNYA